MKNNIEYLKSLPFKMCLYIFVGIALNIELVSRNTWILFLFTLTVIYSHIVCSMSRFAFSRKRSGY